MMHASATRFIGPTVQLQSVNKLSRPVVYISRSKDGSHFACFILVRSFLRYAL